MPRKLPAARIGHDWYLPQWMASARITQAALARKLAWSKATMNDIYNGKTAYYREIVNALAAALNIQPYELLMPPEEAMSIRRLRQAAVTLAADTPKPSLLSVKTGTNG